MSLFSFLRERWFRRQLAKGVSRLLDTPVEQAMTDFVVTISPEKSVTEAASIMIGEDVSTLVVEREGRPIGVLTEHDFITKVPFSVRAFKLRVKDVMSCATKKSVCAVEAVHPGATLSQAAELMRREKIRKLIVTRPDGLLAGIITQTDLSRKIYEELVVAARLSSTPFTVKEVMTSPVVTIDEGAGFPAAKRLMAVKNVHAIPVKRGREYVGILTEYDVVAQFFDAGGRLETNSLRQLVKSPIKTIPGSISIFDANTIMLFEGVRRLLVVADGRVAGIVTQTDLVHAAFQYAVKAREELRAGFPLSLDDFIPCRRKGVIASRYESEHLRLYFMRESSS